MVVVYTHSLRDRYIAPFISIAVLFNIAYYVALFIIPILLSYNTNNFWVKHSNYFEQPHVEFRKEYFLQAYGINFFNNGIGQISQIQSTTNLLWSSFPSYNSKLGNLLTSPLQIYHSTQDLNQDGKDDLMEGSIVFPLSSITTINSVNLIMQFSVSLYDKIKLNQQSAVIFTHSSPLPGRIWNLNGDLKFVQENPFPHASTRTVYNYPLLNDTYFSNTDDSKFENIIALELQRNDTLICPTCSYYSTWLPQSLSPQLSSAVQQSFTVNYTFRIPPSELQYVPGPFETLKFAFIQWLCTFWLVWWILSYARQFVYVNQILETVVRRDTVPIHKLHKF